MLDSKWKDGIQMNRFENNWKFKFLWKFIERPKRILYSFFWRTLLKKDTAYLIQKNVNKYRNQLMLNDINGVIKLLGWTDFYEDDYYYVVQERRYGVKENIFLHSCVIWYTPLKKILSIYDYMNLEHLWNINTLIDIDKELKEKEYKIK